jgi:hypothetical protein
LIHHLKIKHNPEKKKAHEQVEQNKLTRAKANIADITEAREQARVGGKLLTKEERRKAYNALRRAKYLVEAREVGAAEHRALIQARSVQRKADGKARSIRREAQQRENATLRAIAKQKRAANELLDIDPVAMAAKVKAVLEAPGMLELCRESLDTSGGRVRKSVKWLRDYGNSREPAVCVDMEGQHPSHPPYSMSFAWRDDAWRDDEANFLATQTWFMNPLGSDTLRACQVYPNPKPYVTINPKP